ncbi:MAG: helix-turn-helix transcriptional regulator [Oscillospiraceae bacterium]|nr:helix-turn-helix transcriptional regulator [Oscillospiraceae bacterium]
MFGYEKYKLSRIVTVQEIVSADLMRVPRKRSLRHTHAEAWELCCCIRGQMEVERGETVTIVQEGEVLLISPGVEHAPVTKCKGDVALVVSFTCTNSEHLRPLQEVISDMAEESIPIANKIVAELEASFMHNRGAYRLHLLHFVPSLDTPLGAEQLVCCYLEQLLILLLRQVTMEKGAVVRTDYFKKAMQGYLVEQVDDYIVRHIRKRLTVEEIAEYFHYSRTRLSTVYKQIKGIGINDSITQEQLRQAKILLTNTDKSITQIAEELGFSSPQYFSRKFTKKVGVAPSHYAQNRSLHDRPLVEEHTTE